MSLQAGGQVAVPFRDGLAQVNGYTIMLGCSSSFKEKMQVLQDIRKQRWGQKAK